MTRDMAKVRPGRVAYTVWCDDQGQVVDDGTDTTTLTPTISKRSITTSVAVQSGQTIEVGRGVVSAAPGS